MTRFRSALILVVFLFLAACGKEEDPCADGACVDSCSDALPCDTGFQCIDATCEALYPCGTTDDCERGVCVEGACVNADICTDLESCLPQHGCEDNVCVFDRCAGVECDRGVCSTETGACVNSQVCTDETEVESCVEGSVCYGQECVTEMDVCLDLDCERGVCDTSQKACVNDANCSDDIECLQGFFCDDANTCQENLCLDGVNCNRGVCDRGTADCVNASPCDDADACLDGFLCIGTECVATADACDGGCPGNQTCEYSAISLTVTCEENLEGCSRALDCKDDRTCIDGACVAPPACTDDANEPNNDVATAARIIDFFGNVANGNICAGDTDVFLFHTDDSPVFTGDLVVSLQMAPVDIGNGTIALEVQKPDGTKTTEAIPVGESAVRIVVDVGVLDLGEYVIRVLDDAVETAGVSYQLFANLLDDTVGQACASPTLLGATPIVGNSTSGNSYTLGSSCTSEDNPAGEDIYLIDLAEEAYVVVEVVPDQNVDISFAIRTFCENSVADLACENDQLSSGQERFGGRLQPGQYYVVVQGPDTNTGGNYTIRYSERPIICGDADNMCLDADNARFCNATQTAFETELCVNGCDMNLGLCARTPGDVCYATIDATGGYSGTIEFELFENDFDPGPNGCVPTSNGSQTNGPDAVYEVDLPAGHLVYAQLDPEFIDYVSLYIVTDCADMASCQMASNNSFSSTEELTYVNVSGVDETVFVIADAEADVSYGIATIDIVTGLQICTPGSTQCAGDTIETCNALGTAYDGAICSFGCAAGTCNPVPNNLCGGAIDILAGPQTARIDEYTPNYNPGSFCTGRSNFSRDAVYQFTATTAGKVATVTANATFDVGLWVSKDCASTPSCLGGADSVGQNTETVQFLTEANETYYVYVDTASSSYTGTFTVSVTLDDPVCTPGELLGCVGGTTLEYCGDFGTPVAYPCSSTCTVNQCDVPVGEICWDALVTGPGTYMGDFSGTGELTIPAGVSGQCNFSPGEEPVGVDTFYKIDLNPGDFLFADYSSSTSFAVMYLMGACGTDDTCLAQTSDGTVGSLVYEALGAETVYLVMDRTTPSSTSSSYTLDIEILQQNCTPGTPSTCQADGITLSYCDGLGFSRNYACTGTCTAGACDTPGGDICADPLPVVDGTMITRTFQQSVNAIEPRPPRDGFCFFDGSAVPRGNDTIYVANLNPGETIRAEMVTAFSVARIYILTDCYDTSTCQSNNYDTNNDVATYFSPTGGPVFIVVDSSSTFPSSTTYDLSIEIYNGSSCTPNRAMCDTPNSVSICDASGSGTASAFSCLNGCVDGACVPDVGINVCTTAPNSNGTHIYDVWSNYTNDISMPAGSCTGSSGSGPDLYYTVSVNPGQVLHAELQNYGIEDGMLYAFTDCANAELTCVAGSKVNSSDHAELFYAPVVPETLIVGADSTLNSDEEFSFTVEVLAQECVPGQAPTCANNSGIEYCNDYGLFEFYTCSGGCTNDVCASPTGQACFDAIPVSSGQAVVGTFLGTNAIRPPDGAIGTCNFGPNDRPIGADTVYAIDLQVDDVLTASYTSGTSFAMMYLMEDCDDDSTCIENTVRGTTGVINYIATQPETVYIVMDRSLESTASTTYTLSINVAQSCQIGAPPVCNGTQIEYCNGGMSETYDCVGTCTNGACDVPVGGACIDAVAVSAGANPTGNFGGTNTFDPSNLAGSCNFNNEPPIGVDYFYAIDLLANETLTAAYTSTSSYAMVYIMSDCFDEQSCLSNSLRGTSGQAVYTAPSDQTVYVVIDRALADAPVAYTWDLTLSVN